MLLWYSLLKIMGPQKNRSTASVIHFYPCFDLKYPSEILFFLNNQNPCTNIKQLIKLHTNEPSSKWYYIHIAISKSVFLVNYKNSISKSVSVYQSTIRFLKTHPGFLDKSAFLTTLSTIPFFYLKFRFSGKIS